MENACSLPWGPFGKIAEKTWKGLNSLRVAAVEISAIDLLYRKHCRYDLLGPGIRILRVSNGRQSETILLPHMSNLVSFSKAQR